jgi:hypothetical protein
MKAKHFATDLSLPTESDFDFDTFEIKTLADFDVWNRHARIALRKARQFDKHAQPVYPIKVPDASFYESVRIKFQRFDQPDNVLKVWVRNKDIDWRGQLKPGHTYDLPKPVVKFLNKLAVPVYGEVDVKDGGDTIKETKQIGERARFSCQRVEDY